MQDLYSVGGMRQGGGTASQLLRVQLPICDREMLSEVASDVSLPDYQPEIKRLLRVQATVQPPSHYVGGGAMEFTGSVDYCIVYTGNDGQIYCYPTSSDYTVRVPLEAGPDFDLNDGLVCYAQCESESVISRVAGPRRMSLKCRLRAHVKAYASCIMEEKRQGVMGETGEERLLCEVDTTVSGYGVSAPITVSDEVLLQREETNGTGEGADYRIISGDAQVLVGETLLSSGRIHCRGEVVMKLLLQREQSENSPISLVRKLPFEGDVIADSADINGRAVVFGSCSELSLSMEEGRVLCEAEIVLQARTYRDETVFYISDWYATGVQSECTFSEHALPRLLKSVSGNFTQSETRTLEELGIDPDVQVIDVSGTAAIDGFEIDKGRYVLSGKCRYTLVLCHDGEMSAKEIELPFRYLPDGTAASDAITGYEGQVCVLTARARMDAQRLAIDAELGVWLCVLGERPMRAVNGVSCGDKIARAEGQMLLCYPSREDTLWSVGKRYHVPLDEIVKNNRLPGEHRADAADSLGKAGVLVI